MWDHMGGYGGYGGWWGLGWISMILFWVLLVLAIAAVIRWLMGTPPSSAGRPRRALDILEERYAKGEIDRQEYLEKKNDLEES